MDDLPVHEDLKRLLGDDYREAPGDEQKQRIKDALDYSRFTPDHTPDRAESSYYNPALDGYRDAGLSWGESGWEPPNETAPLRKYSEYLPTDPAIQTLIDLGPLVEVGSGNGYWAHVLNENGGDCIPTDRCPPDCDGDDFPVTNSYGEDSLDTTIWANVQEYDGEAAVRTYSNRAVLMCHPDGADRWSERVLDAVEDQPRPFVFVGEWYPGADATPWFFKRLATEWTLVDEFPVYNWATSRGHGYVFEARHAR